MKGKYITTQILLACLSHKKVIQPNIHDQLKEAIAERKRLLLQWRRLLFSWMSPDKLDVYAELEKTIAERKMIMQKWEKLFSAYREIIITIDDKRAA